MLQAGHAGASEADIQEVCIEFDKQIKKNTGSVTTIANAACETIKVCDDKELLEESIKYYGSAVALLLEQKDELNTLSLTDCTLLDDVKKQLYSLVENALKSRQDQIHAYTELKQAAQKRLAELGPQTE